MCVRDKTTKVSKQHTTTTQECKFDFGEPGIQASMTFADLKSKTLSMHVRAPDARLRCVGMGARASAKPVYIYILAWINIGLCA